MKKIKAELNMVMMELNTNKLIFRHEYNKSMNKLHQLLVSPKNFLMAFIFGYGLVALAAPKTARHTIHMGITNYLKPLFLKSAMLPAIPYISLILGLIKPTFRLLKKIKK